MLSIITPGQQWHCPEQIGIYDQPINMVQSTRGNVGILNCAVQKYLSLINRQQKQLVLNHRQLKSRFK